MSRPATRPAGFLLCTVLWLAAGCAEEPADSGDSADAATPVASDAATAGEPISFELTDMHGELRSSEEWNGRPKLINFWATWCAPCRREIPLLKETQREAADIDLQVIGIAVDFPDEVVAYDEEIEFNYPVLVGQEDAMAVAEASGVEFIGLPFTMVVSASGHLVKTHVGEIVEEQVDEITDVLAAMQQGELDLAGARERLGAL